MADYVVLVDTPIVVKAVSQKAAIAAALAQMDGYKDAEGTFRATLWVGELVTGGVVNANVTVSQPRTLDVVVTP